MASAGRPLRRPPGSLSPSAAPGRPPAGRERRTDIVARVRHELAADSTPIAPVRCVKEPITPSAYRTDHQISSHYVAVPNFSRSTDPSRLWGLAVALRGGGRAVSAEHRPGAPARGHHQVTVVPV